jgi:spermidine synthase
MTSRRALLFYTAFLLSGASGLIYEVTWLKALTLIFGSTTYAASTVLACFMGGLGLGSWLIGRRVERYPDIALVYVFLEVGIALSAIVSFAALPLIRTLYYYAGGGMAVRIGGSAALLLLPTFLMGGTLPVLVGLFRAGERDTGRPVGRLYAINTAGAVLGSLAAGFALIPHFGVIRTALAGAAANLVAAALAFLAARQGVLRAQRGAHKPSPAIMGRRGQVFLWVAFLSGATSMILEVVWTRLLATPLGGSTYGFTVMLVAFLVGIAAGSRLFVLLVKWMPPGRKGLGLLQLGTALAGLLALAIWRDVPQILFALMRRIGDSFEGIVAVQCVGAFLILLLPALLYGIAFPWVAALYAPDERSAARRLGRMYAVNTLGAIAGSLLAGFLLVPRLGSYAALFVAIAGSAAAGLLLIPGRQRLAAGGLCVALLGAAWGAGMFRSTALDTEAVVPNFFHNAPFSSTLSPEETAGIADVVFLGDGLNATVAVLYSENSQVLKINGKTDASSSDMRTQVMLGVLPLACHPAPRDVLVIGFGSGATARVAALWPGVERVDVVEIEPAVLRAAPFLSQLNGESYRDPRVHLIEDDARHFLFTTRRKYDVIISEPSNPWIAGIGNLFTREFYQEAAARLGDHGVFVQWVQGYQFLVEDLQLVGRTLRTAFPDVTLWNGQPDDFLLLAAREPVSPATGQYRELFRNASEHAATLRDLLQQHLAMEEAAGIWAYFQMGRDRFPAFAGSGEVNSDDRPLLEYRAPWRLAPVKDRPAAKTIQADATPALPSTLSPDERLAAAETLLRSGELTPTLTLARKLELDPELRHSARFWLFAGDFDLAAKRPDLAESSYRQALEKGAGLRAQAGLAMAAASAGDPRAIDLLEQAIRAAGSLRERYARELTMALIPVLYERSIDEAIDWQKRFIAADPPSPYVRWLELARMYARKGDMAAAEQAAERSLALEPRGFDARFLLGEIYQVQDRRAEASREFLLALRRRPSADLSFYEKAAAALRAAGQGKEAERILARARRHT